MTEIVLHLGNIAKRDSEAIVNAANEMLLPGSGVCGAIHETAGAELELEYRKIGGCDVGAAVITKGYSLRAKWVIHTVGPRYFENISLAPTLLAKSYRSCLELASQKDIEEVAFPCISTGAFGYPKPEAAVIAVKTVVDFIHSNPTAFEKIVFCCFEEDDYENYREVLGREEFRDLNFDDPGYSDSAWEKVMGGYYEAMEEVHRVKAEHLKKKIGQK